MVVPPLGGDFAAFPAKAGTTNLHTYHRGDHDVTSDETRQMFARYVVPNYGRFPIALVRGEGSHVWDAEGNRYLDLYCGAGCNLLGHCPPALVEAVRDQLGRLVQVPQTWHTEPQSLWAQALSQRSFGGQAFFCNSGSEAVEAAIKLVRLHAKKPRYKIITFEGGFHGHSLAATAATAEPKYHEGLGPLMTGFTYAPLGDLEAVWPGDQRRHGGLVDRADPRRCGRAGSTRGVSGWPAANGRRARAAVDIRRGPDRLRPHRRLVRLPGLRRYARRDDAFRRPLRRARRRGHAGRGGNRPKPAAGGARAALSAATRSPPAPAWP